MSPARMILEAVRQEVSRQKPKPVTAWATVTVVSPLSVEFDGDDVPVLAAVGVTPSVGDTVGLTKYGTRWYATAILKEA